MNLRIMVPGRFMCSILRTQVQKYSQYPSIYIHPIFREADQKKAMESGEAQKLSFVPVRAALSDQTCSAFYDPLKNKLISRLTKGGNKLLARTLVEKSFETIKRIQLEKLKTIKDPEKRDKIVTNPFEILRLAVENTRPFLETTPIKRGGHTYQVPIPLTEKRSYFLAIRWLIEAGADKDDDMRFYNKFAYELIEAANNQGRVVKRKQDLHKVCESNRAYAHYRWS